MHLPLGKQLTSCLDSRRTPVSPLHAGLDLQTRCSRCASLQHSAGQVSPHAHPWVVWRTKRIEEHIDTTTSGTGVTSTMDIAVGFKPFLTRSHAAVQGATPS